MDIRTEVLRVMENADEMLNEDNCTGYPYLKLGAADYNFKNNASVFADLVRLMRKYGANNKWQNSKCCFFDVHPVFSSGIPIPSLLGLHLSLILFEKGVAASSEHLYFDTATNWLEFSRITEKKIYSVASWVKFSLADIYEEGDVDADASDDIFLRTSINLIKGNELSGTHTEAPTEFDLSLKNYYKGLDSRNILINEINEFRSFIDYDLTKHPLLESSALYLFSVVFCREFGIAHSVFVSIVNELGLVFDFGDDRDVVSYTYKVLAYLQTLKIQLGDYEHQLLDYSQVHESFIRLGDAESPADNITLNQSDSSNLAYIEEKKNYSIEGVSRYYEMAPAIKEDSECRKLIYNYWREFVILFYGEELTQDLYDKLRSMMDSHVTAEMAAKKILSFDNAGTQLKAIRIAAYDVYRKTIYGFNIVAKGGSLVAERLFADLHNPKLTDVQQTSINLLNEKAQKEMIAEIFEDHLRALSQLLSQSIGKIAHSNFSNELGSRLAQIEQETFRQMVIRWYRENYIHAYMELSLDFEEVYMLIKRDATQFAQDPLVEKSMLMEVRYFVTSIYNPHLILDFNTNY